MVSYSLEEVKDKHIGMPDTEGRDNYEKSLKAETDPLYFAKAYYVPIANGNGKGLMALAEHLQQRSDIEFAWKHDNLTGQGQLFMKGTRNVWVAITGPMACSKTIIKRIAQEFAMNGGSFGVGFDTFEAIVFELSNMPHMNDFVDVLPGVTFQMVL